MLLSCFYLEIAYMEVMPLSKTFNHMDAIVTYDFVLAILLLNYECLTYQPRNSHITNDLWKWREPPRIIRVSELPLHTMKTMNTKCMEAHNLDTILGSIIHIIERVHVMPKRWRIFFLSSHNFSISNPIVGTKWSPLWKYLLTEWDNLIEQLTLSVKIAHDKITYLRCD